MKSSYICCVLFYFIIGHQFEFGNSFKILGIFHTSSRSHFIAGNALMKGLANAGHDVTVMSQFPEKKPIKNYREIDITNPNDAMRSM